MSEQTAISWTDSTVSFWIGCTKVSPGCSACYAEKEDRRHLHEPISHWGKGAPRYKCKGAVKSLLAMNRLPWLCDCGTVKYRMYSPHMIACPKCGSGYHRRKVFINQQADWLDPEVPIEWLAEMLDTIRLCPELDIMLLTKRAELWRRQIGTVIWHLSKRHADEDVPFGEWLFQWLEGTPPANVMIGTTVEDQKRADERIPELLKIPAKFRFLSVEPMLEEVALLDVATGWPFFDQHGNRTIHLVIIGCESLGRKPGRNCDPMMFSDAAGLIVDQCRGNGVTCFVKQIPVGGRVSTNPAEWPEDLRVQEPFAIERL